MNDFTGWGHAHASEHDREMLAGQIVDETFQSFRDTLVAVISAFLACPLNAKSLFDFETAMLGVIRELGRRVLQAVVQSLEPQTPQLLPRELWFQTGGYRRRGDRTRNANIATRFGLIVLWRRGYRSWERGGETIFPLELMLGLTHSVSPGLLELTGRLMAAMSQQATLSDIKEHCGVSMGVNRLRKCLDTLADSLEPLRESAQIERLLDLLQKATQSRGSRKPVLSVGRDGITLRDYLHSVFEVATAASLSVYDRKGKRLGTVYMAYPPELGQETMDRMLTGLLTGLLERWSGPLPRLAYVTDSGSNEVDYYRRVLKKMKHPITDLRLTWTRVADFYHVSERVWTMADALFTRNQQPQKRAWARRMLKNLKRRSGASRVLHSAASLCHRRKLGKTRKKNFWTAYRYLQNRLKYMKYHDYRSVHIPLGSGVTEAACKTIFTQRLKLSGMRWTRDGARRILTLRTILLSGTWESAWRAFLSDYHSVDIQPYTQNHQNPAKIAA